MPRRSRQSASSAPRASGSSPVLSRRAKVVWLSLLAAMTGVGGLLLAVQGRPIVRSDGLTLTPLVSTTSAVGIDTIFKTRQPLERATWKAIVIHHSGSPAGSPASLEAEHRANGSKGLGHHFVIGNGRGMEDAELHVGYRWLDQHPGHHALGSNADWFNRNAISICLVGNGDRQSFSPAQLARLRQLVTALRTNLQIPADRVYLHSDIAQTTSPGRLFPVSWLREQVAGIR